MPNQVGQYFGWRNADLHGAVMISVRYPARDGETPAARRFSCGPCALERRQCRGVRDHALGSFRLHHLPRRYAPRATAHFLRADGWRPFRQLRAARRRVGAWWSSKLVFAMNGGMFHPDFRPVGARSRGQGAVADQSLSRQWQLLRSAERRLFHRRRRPHVVATDEYRDRVPAFATQSGPMLLHRGQIPDSGAFRSKSRHRRNGVCVTSGSTVAFVISEDKVTFREFAEYFRSLGCTEALYLDGAISSLWSPPLGRADARSELGPIVGVAELTTSPSSRL